MADEYTVSIPGATDIFRVPVPGMDDVELRQERIRRMKAAKTPVPEILQWIPAAINKIDDAQDLLYVGLTLAKPLLRRLPARFIPGLGWALLALDIANLLTLLLSLPIAGAGVKRLKVDMLDIFGMSRLRRLNAVAKFLSRTPLLPFALQAGQVSFNLTGYGLCLGPIMGMISDSFWGLIRKAQGADVNIILPPEADPVGKAARVLAQSPLRRIAPDMLSPEDHELMDAAESIATQILLDRADAADKIEERGDAFAGFNAPVFVPWNPASMEALQKEGFDLSKPVINLASAPATTGKFTDVIRKYASYEQSYQRYRKDMYKTKLDRGTMAQLIASEAGYNIWDIQAGGRPSTSYVLFPAELAFIRSIEYGVFPPRGASPKMITTWLNTAHGYYYYSYAKKVSWWFCLAYAAWAIWGIGWGPKPKYDPTIHYATKYRGPKPKHSLDWKCYSTGKLLYSSYLWHPEIDDWAQRMGCPRLFPRGTDPNIFLVT